MVAIVLIIAELQAGDIMDPYSQMQLRVISLAFCVLAQLEKSKSRHARSSGWQTSSS